MRFEEEPVEHEEGLPEAIPAEEMLDMSHVLQVPGLHHSIYHATAGLGEVMGHYKAFIHQAEVLCKLLRTKACATMWFFSCRTAIHRADPGVKGRGAVSFSVPELLAIESIIRWGWGREKFMLVESEDQGCDWGRDCR